MVELVAKTPANGSLPITHGGTTLRELTFDRITSVAPFMGKEKAVSAALKKSIGTALPDIGRILAGKKGDILWSGRGEFFVLNGDVGKLNAGVTDQSDAWTSVALEGSSAQEILARICPLNFGDMDEGDVARSLIGHMPAIIIVRSDGYELMVFRAFARTLVNEVEQAMKSVAAQADLS